MKTSVLVEDHFSLLSPENRHAASPRLTPDGQTVVYFDNPLSTSNGYLIPGPQDKSRRLMKLNLSEGVLHAKQASYGTLGISIGQVVVGEVHEPVAMHDGNTFYGLYPKFPLPQRCISKDHVMYLTIHEVGTTRTIAIDLNTRQVILQFISPFLLTFCHLGFDTSL